MKENIKKILLETNLQDYPGSIIYSADSTLKKGNFYFLGQNPGGNKEKKYGKDTILNQLLYSGEHNEYTQGEWTGSKGKLHQHNIKRMFKDLELDIEDIFSTNLCFIRSGHTETYNRNMDEDIRLFWPIHRYFLSIVKPNYIIANGAKARDFFKKEMKPINNLEKKRLKKCKRYNHTAESFEGSLKIGDTTLDKLVVLAIPHLSNATDSCNDYDKYYKEGVLWLKNKIVF